MKRKYTVNLSKKVYRVFFIYTYHTIMGLMQIVNENLNPPAMLGRIE